jgi:nucleotide-binding universal stress UspA family protein
MTDPPATILLGYDGSDNARRAIDAAAALFAGAQAVVASVWQPVGHYALTHPAGALATPFTSEVVDELDAIAERQAVEEAEHGAALAAGAGLDAQARTAKAAHPADGLLAIAADLRPAAIVVGTRGRSAVRSVVFGSVSNAVLQASPYPVVVIPPDDRRA